ncbi:hypothetical protein Clacol_006070 [Clathrus columnatus]|uniref:Small ribosomal subunit protein mS33 n=1 Tax=Clathrus columnatus TaxID=1419009 RepID=A0AAV5ADX4_9AGAM|nr:hypothetical protein Clacol_006070 [Clathrus columnatus]
MPAVARARLSLLESLRCSIFATSYNPTSLRTGAKYLRARLRGPSMLNYYPKIVKISHFNKLFPGLDLEDTDEIQRRNDLAALRARGKGAPKKAKTKEQSRRLAKKR